jgi:hypothetical protein
MLCILYNIRSLWRKKLLTFIKTLLGTLDSRVMNSNLYQSTYSFFFLE